LCRNCPIIHVIERKIEGRREVTERRERRSKQLLDRSWIVHILCRNCPVIHIIERKIEGRREATERRERRSK
jgi:hypothetical protein